MKRNIKEQIVIEMNSLLEQYPFEKITTQMIADRACISKATFYRYFKDKQEVLCCNCDRLLAESVRHAESFHDMFLYMTIGYAGLGLKTGRAIAAYTGSNNYMEYCYQTIMEFVEETVKKNRGGRGMTENEAFQCSILASGISHIFPALSLKCSEEQAGIYADLLTEMVPESLRDMKL